MRRACLFLLLVSATATANDGSGSIATSGTVSFLGQHPTVRLVEERIDVKLPEGRVRVAFRFRNEGPARQVTMAFPENGYRAKEMPGYHKGRRSQFGYFRTWVDGVSVRPVLRDLTYRGPESDGLDYKYAWTKTVSFPANGERSVVNEYQGGLTFGPPWSVFRGFTYVLQTGGTWKGGKIGKTTVVVDARDVLKHSPVRAQPEGWTQRNGLYVWQRADFKPEEDIYVNWLEGFWNLRVEGKWAEDLLTEGGFGSTSAGIPVRKGDEVHVPLGIAARLLGASWDARGRSLLREGRSAPVGSYPVDRKLGTRFVPFLRTARALGWKATWAGDIVEVRR